MTLYIIKYNIKVRNLTLVQYCEADYRCHSLFRIFYTHSFVYVYNSVQYYPYKIQAWMYRCPCTDMDVLPIPDTGVDIQIPMYRYGCITHPSSKRGYTDTHVQIWMYYPSQIQAWIYRYPCTDMDVLPIPDPGVFHGRRGSPSAASWCPPSVPIPWWTLVGPPTQHLGHFESVT